MPLIQDDTDLYEYVILFAGFVAAGDEILADGLAWFAGVTAADCNQIEKITGRRKPKERPFLHSLNPP